MRAKLIIVFALSVVTAGVGATYGAAMGGVAYIGATVGFVIGGSLLGFEMLVIQEPRGEPL